MSTMTNFLIVGGNQKKRWQKTEELYQEKKGRGEIEKDPDTFLLKSSKNVGIEKIREIKHWLSLKPYLSPPKILIIFEVQNLTFEAQSLLNKILEEPQRETIKILTASSSEALLPTINSRCQIINLPPQPEIEISEEEKEENLVLLKKILAFSPGEKIKFVEKIKNREEAEKFCQIQILLWREILIKNPKKEVVAVIRRIQKILKFLKHNVNYRLALENLLFSYPNSKTMMIN
jgi:hypothetical protein